MGGGLTLAQKEELSIAGRIEEAKKANAYAQAAIETERAILELRLKKKLEAMKGHPPRLIFSSCRFTAEDEKAMVHLFHSGIFSKQAVQKMRGAALRHPMLSDARLARLSAVPLVEKDHPVEPWWLSVVANCRDSFRDTAVVIGRGDAARFYKFLYAKKAPRGAVFCPLVLREPEHTRVLGLAEHIGREASTWRYTFSCERMNTMEAWQIDSDPASTVSVLLNLIDMGDQLVSDGGLYFLSTVVEGHPGLGKRSTETTPGPRAQRTAEQKAEWNRLLIEYPWLAETATGATRAKRARVTGSHRLADEESGDEQEEEADALDEEIEEILDEESLDKIFSDLVEMREDWSVRFSAVVLADFKTGLLGGASTYRATGSKGKPAVVADFVCCEVESAQAKDFVFAYALQKSKRASIDKYGLGPATVLVEAWGHKMQYYLDCYFTSGNAKYTFVVADHEAYTEPASFKELAEGNTAVEVVVNSIRSLMPFFLQGQVAALTGANSIG